MINTNKEQGELPKEVVDEREEAKKALSDILKKGRKPHEIVRSMEQTIEAKELEIAEWEKAWHATTEQMNAMYAELSDLKAKNNKLMELLKGVYRDYVYDEPLPMTGIESNYEADFKQFLAENGLNEEE